MKRKWLFWLLVIIFLGVVISRFTELEKLVHTLTRGQWQWVLMAALLQMGYHVLNAAMYQAAFETVEIESKVQDLIPVTLGSLFVNVVAPGGGAALFVEEARRRGQSVARAAAGTLLSMTAEFSTFALVLVLGLAVLFTQHNLKAYEAVAALALLLIIGGLSAVLLVGLWRPEYLRRLLQWLQEQINYLAAMLHRTPPLTGDWAQRNAVEFTEAGLAAVAHPARLMRTLLVALLAHMVDLTSLYVLFRAFHQHVGLGILVAGYAMGVLFWIVAITPQGIGVVEGVMALVYTSLGVPAARSTVIALAYRGLSFWVPLGMGFLLLRRVRAFGAEQRTRSEVWSVHGVALLTALTGAINVLSAVTPSVAARLAVLERLVPLATRQGARLTAALTGFALLVLARSLWRRKRVAWLLTLAALSVSAFSHLTKGLDWEEASLAAAVALWLWLARAEFHARSDPIAVGQGLKALGAALAFTLGYGVTGFYLLDRHFATRFGLAAALRQTVIMFTQFYDPGLQPVTAHGRYFVDSIYTVGGVTLAYAAFMLLRPVLVRRPATREERARARAIVKAYGHSSLACFTLMEDKSYHFSPGGSLIAYVVKGRVALALGDPIGPPADVAATIADFRQYCTSNDWQPAFYQTLPDYLPLYRTEGFSDLSIGQEAIVRLGQFDLSGSANKKLRFYKNHLTKIGYRAELHEPPLPEPLLHELRLVSNEWLAWMHGAEKRFSLGWFDDEYIRQSPVLAIHDAQGVALAFANLVPEYQLNECSVDLMRHRRNLEAGTMEFLFVSLFEWAKEHGYDSFNLGLSALVGVGEDAQSPGIERALHYIYGHIDQFYNFQGLHQFKAKFDPMWSPRYLVFPGAASLPAVAMALIRADSGDDFLESYGRSLVRTRIAPGAESVEPPAPEHETQVGG